MDTKLYDMVEKLRKELHEMVDRELNILIQRLDTDEPVEEVDVILPLSTMPSYFKGKKPLSLVYPDGTEVSVTSWKNLAYHLLNDCAKNPEMRNRLHHIQNKVSGRDRVLLSSTGEGMDRPIEFCDNMFFESKFDAETMLRVITARIFKPIGYDYHRINLKVIDPRIQALAEQSKINETQIAEQENEIGMEMTM